MIGSGATAVTLVPAMADDVEHITMLQRTPSYVLPAPRIDPIALLLRRLFGDRRGYALTRRKNIEQQRMIWGFCQRFPRAARRVIRAINAKQLPDGYPVDEHFNPPYDPWDQRLCAVPDGDLYTALGSGKASIVTDRIETITETGIRLQSGEELPADIIVTATGLTLRLLGGIDVSVDGEPLVLPDKVVYRGTMLTGVPNLAMSIGYTNSSWTLKVGLLCEYFCALLGYMDQHGYDTAWAEADPDIPTRPLLDFDAGYVTRSLHELPKQGPAAPWLMSMNFHDDRRLVRGGGVVDEHLHLEGPDARAGRRPVAAPSAPRTSRARRSGAEAVAPAGVEVGA